jgi:hypothetical protein
MFEGKVFCVDCKYSKEFFDTSGPVTLTTGLYQCTHEKHTIPNYVTGVNSYDFCQGINVAGVCKLYVDKIMEELSE